MTDEFFYIIFGLIILVAIFGTIEGIYVDIKFKEHCKLKPNKSFIYSDYVFLPSTMTMNITKRCG